MTTTTKPPKLPTPARAVMARLLILGLVLIAFGTGLALAHWPGTEVGYDPFLNEPVSTNTGDPDLAGLGVFLLGLGSLFTQVWVVAWGVSIGTRDRDETRLLRRQ